MRVCKLDFQLDFVDRFSQFCMFFTISSNVIHRSRCLHFVVYASIDRGTGTGIGHSSSCFGIITSSIHSWIDFQSIHTKNSMLQTNADTITSCVFWIFKLSFRFFYLWKKNRTVFFLSKEKHTKQSMNNEKKKQHIERENECDDILLRFLTSQNCFDFHFRAMHNGSRTISNNQNIQTYTEIQSKPIQIHRLESIQAQTSFDHIPFDGYLILCVEILLHYIKSIFITMMIRLCTTSLLQTHRRALVHLAPFSHS